MIWGLSLHGWEEVMRVSLAVVGVSGLLVGLATIFVVTLTREEVAESKRELEEYKLDAGTKISAAEAIGLTAKAEAAKANAQIAEASARQKEAELKLEQLRDRMRQRHINGDQFLKILEGRPKAPVEILFIKDDGEAFQLSLEIRDWLKRASWEVEEPRPITGADLAPRLAQNHPSAMAAGGQPQGVSLFLRAEGQADFDREADNPLDANAPINTPRKALSRALLESLGTLSGGMSGENGRPGVLRIIVGPKPQLN